MRRLAQGGRIDRAAPLSFSFDGKALTGFAGDTLASALIANGIYLTGRSFKYHRPRGILTAGPDEPHALVTLGRGAAAEPNLRATMVELSNGMAAFSQNRWPSLRFDLLALNQLAGPLFSAGFYYKTFMWPAALWERLYEPFIRRAAGLGALPAAEDPNRYDKAHGFCDLLVVGAGPAGLAAALTAARAGLKVIIAEEEKEPGGRLLSEQHRINGQDAGLWVAQAWAELTSLPHVTCLTRTLVWGAYDGGEYAAMEQTGGFPGAHKAALRARLWKIHAPRVILASGAIERPMLFDGNDRPGVMMASAVETYITRFAVRPGQRAVIAAAADSAYASAARFLAAGIPIAALADARPAPNPALVADLRDQGVTVLTGTRVTAVSGVPVRQVKLTGATGNLTLEADLVAMAGGFNPQTALAAGLGHRPVWDGGLAAYVAKETPPGMILAGAAAGRFSLAAALEGGEAAAYSVLREKGLAVPPPLTLSGDDEPAGQVLDLPPGPFAAKVFVDFQHDVTARDVFQATQEGFRSGEHMKRYTTLGMGTDQGKMGAVLGHALLAHATGKEMGHAGTILARPPVRPVPIGVLAGPHRGRDFRPVRHTPGHSFAVEQGAIFTDAGFWKRAQWFPKPGEKDWLESVTREVTATRNVAGICDVSTLGKIELCGPDAGLLLDRLYINGFSTLPAGKARYGVMLREDGFVMDDGTTTRLGADHFYLTTTTANAAKVMQHIDYARQVLWPEMNVQAVSVTEQWAAFSIAGPKAREILSAFLPEIDISNTALPYLGALEFTWQGASARLFRLSFSGELGYEIAITASHGGQLIRALWALARDMGATLYGTEALSVMRIEKGHPAGNELNGQTTASDLGLGRMMSAKKDFIGKRLAARPALTDPMRPRLVGVKPVIPGARIRAGAHLLPRAKPARAEFAAGHVTSAAYSPSLGHWIGLALLKGGAERHGEDLVLHDPVRGADIVARVCDPVFLDPEGARVRA